MDVAKERFNFTYENNSTSSFLVINMSSNEKILEYQIEMLHNNSCQGILSLNVRQKNDEIKLYYNITSKLTLKQFLKRKKLSKIEFINILTGITETLIKSKEYFLYDNGFIIDEELIYINPSSLETEMAYIPVSLDTNAGQSFKSFLGKLIISSVKIDEDSSGSYIQKILNYLKQDDFSISDFDKLLKDIKNKESKEKLLGNKESNHPLQKSIHIHKDTADPKENVRHVNIKDNGAETIGNKRINKIETAKESDEEIETAIKKKYHPKYIIIAILSQIPIIITLVFSLDTIIAVAGDAISGYLGAALIVAAIDILLFRYLFKEEHMEEIKISNRKIESKSSLTGPSVNMSKREKYSTKESSAKMDSHIKDEEVYELVNRNSPNQNETVILDKESKEYAYLQRMNNGIIDNVAITKENFIIGRLPNYADYLIENSAIGRTHAEIFRREDKYFIKDLNSKNGTFINEARIDSNKEYHINNGDILKFANIEYTFLC